MFEYDPCLLITRELVKCLNTAVGQTKTPVGQVIGGHVQREDLTQQNYTKVTDGSYACGDRSIKYRLVKSLCHTPETHVALCVSHAST